MKLLLITDSLGLPRLQPEIVHYNETWCYLVKKKLERQHNEIHQLSLGGGTVRCFLRQMSYLSLFEPDVVVVQSGLVDLAPRALTECEKYWINNFSITRRIMKLGGAGLIKILRKRNVTYTSKVQFQNSVLEFSNLFREKLYWVSIIAAGDRYEKKIPGIRENIVNYNKIIKRILKERFIDTSQVGSDCLMSDHHHLNVLGHQCLSELVISSIYK